MPRTLDDWLAHCERLHPQGIDLSLWRVSDVLGRMGLQLQARVFTVAGTNGKGSTCAMLEAILLRAGYRVGVYTSPHLVHFVERCRIDGSAVRPQELVPHFEAVEAARAGVALTYFEFTTLAILSCLAQARLDAVVLEVGLGGRLDAVNAVDADCAVVTCIDIDHAAWLGPDRESIGREKAGILRTGRPAIVTDPHAPVSLIDHAREIGADLWRHGHDFQYAVQDRQWSWTGRGRRLSGLAFPALLGHNQLLNAAGVLAALESMRDAMPVTAQAIREGLALVELPGRFQVVPGEPVIVLDVAHNPHAAAALARNLDQMGFYPRTHAVFGVMADKDIDGIVRPLAPLVDTWHLCDLPTARAAQAIDLERMLAPLAAAGADAPRVICHAEPRGALDAALGGADPADRILVFGSFFTVGGVLADGLPRLGARHLR
jgi:dihydrofolate synthase/folylpolyglutamate synthase